jgi:hypothetical protein
MHRFALAPLFISAALVAGIAQANPMADVAGGTTTYWSKTDSTYSVAGVDQEFSHNRIALDFSEKGNDWFYGGITIGFEFLDAQSEPLIADTGIPGYLFGVFGGVRQQIFMDGLAVNAEGRYFREWVSGSVQGGTDETSVKFGEGSLRLGLSYRFEEVQFSLGAYSSNVVGEITRTGVVSGTARFEDTDSSGAYLGADIKLYEGFALGLRAESGARETIAITFSSGFWRPQ